MTDNELLRKRFAELIKRSASGYYFTFTSFLGLAEQSVLRGALGEMRCEYTLFGGAPDTERVICRFGDKGEIGYDQPFPISCILISAKDKKFKEKLSHRDYLGTLMGLGIERDTLGDIVIREEGAYLFCEENIAPFIVDNLFRVRHTEVIAGIVNSLPEGELYHTKEINVQVASPRADAVISKVFSLSRDDSLTLFKRGLVYRNGFEIDTPSKQLNCGDIVSVRGYGRFIFVERTGLTRRGRENISIKLFE